MSSSFSSRSSVGATLLLASTLLSSVMLAGCLRGGSSEPTTAPLGGNSTPAAASGNSRNAAPSPVTAPTPLPTVQAGGLITSVTVTDRGNQPLAGRVVTFGQPFIAGHVPQGVVVAMNGQALPTQVDVKRRHADGSVRHAVLSAVLPASASASRVDLELRQASTMPSPGAGLDAAAALSGGFDIVLEVVEAGQTYRASAAELIRAQASRWLEGAIATELRVRGSLKNATAAHPVFEALFDVRFFSPTSARVVVVFENALAKPERGERTASFRILDQSGAVLFNQANVYVPQHARFRKVFDWGASRTKSISIAGRLPYLVGTGVAPRYDTTKTLEPQAITEIEAYAATGLNEIFGNGIITSYMPTTGGRGDIGVLPHWTAVALYTGDPRATDVMLAAGDYAGSFPVHLRDPATGKPYSIDRHPTVSNGWWGNAYATAADALPPCDVRCPAKETLAADDPRRTSPAIFNRIHQSDTAHQPSLAFMPYVLTGDPYYLDELVFWASHNFLSMVPAYRQLATGLFKDEQPRGQAWSLRTLAQAAWIVPDVMQEERAYFEAKLAANLDWYNRNAVDSNAFGFWGEGSNVAFDSGRPQPDFAPNVRSFTSPWQVDYLMVALDYVEGLGNPAARPFRTWLARLPIARYAGEWPRADAVVYQIATRWIPAGCGLLATPQTLAGCPSEFPLYASFAEMAQATFARRAAGAVNGIRAPTCAICYEANARAALAGAVRAGLPNAQAAYDSVVAEMTAAMTSFGRDTFLRDPTWLIVP